MNTICIQINSTKIKAQFNESETAKKIWNSLPLRAEVNTWGEEIYFAIPVKVGLEKTYAKEIVELGDLGYWPEGHCFCIFFGLTPASRGNEIRPASAVNVIGKVQGELEFLKKIKDGQKIEVKKEEIKEGRL